MQSFKSRTLSKLVMPGLVAAFAEASAGLTPNPPKPWRRRMPGIHVFGATCEKDVDGRDKPGHDEIRVRDYALS
jgi:hypothetical protein